MKKVGPNSPEYLLKEPEYLQSRIKDIKNWIENRWPEACDAHSRASSNFEEEIDKAIFLLKRRKNRLIKNRPKKQRGGQVTWDEDKCKALLILDDALKEVCKTTKERIERHSELWGIEPKKMRERIKKARESLKT